MRKIHRGLSSINHSLNIDDIILHVEFQMFPPGESENFLPEEAFSEGFAEPSQGSGNRNTRLVKPGS